MATALKSSLLTLGIAPSRMRSLLRREWMRSEARKQVKRAARIVGTKLYLCAECKRPSDKPQVDHKEPVGALKSLDEYARRLFCPASGLRVLCAKCHKKKTAEERKAK